MSDAPKYSAAWVAQQAAGKSWLDHHDCGVCGAMVGYLINDGRVAFCPGCNCSWSPPEPSSFEAIADWLAMQSSDEIRDRIMAGLKA